MANEENRTSTELPADKSAESNLLSSMILEPGRIGKIIERVTEDAFYYPAHRTIYSAILAWYTKPAMDDQGQIDILAIRGELERMGKFADDDTGAEDVAVSQSYLEHIAGLTPSIADVTYYADRVLECRRDRELLHISAEIEKVAQEPGPSDEKIQHLQERVLQLNAAKADMELVGLGDGLTQHARALHDESARRVDSGFIAIDHHIGGFYPGDLVVIGARPSMGKTSLALNVALNAALAGTGVLFISLEMTVPQLRNRALCMLAGLSLAEVRHNPNLDSEKQRALFNAAERYEKEPPPLFITNAGHTPAEQTALLKQYGRRQKIGLVVIDYFQLMITDHRQQNLRHMATELSRGVKRMAQAEDVPILLASQLSPEQEGRENVSPRLSDLREFGSLDQDADIIMLLFREDYYRRRDLTYGHTGTFEIDIAKHRNGPTGHVSLMFDKQKMMFRDCIGAL
ncbi:MAG: AAA family ATPase [Phycisphaerales bacterium]|nr:MAG: AAA family ATPase [Phycisphaerales bacterium]